MKLSILYESRNPKQPTDLSLVATQSTKDGARRGKYPVNFYSGKIGKKSSGKVVLGYHDKDDKFRTTGPIVGIVQSKKAPDRWLIKTENNGPYYYSIQMPEATVMSTYNRYLKGTASTPIPIYTYDQNTKKHTNKKDAGKIANQEEWSYYNGTKISMNKMPTRKPKTSVEAYDYLMYWAYHNHGGNSLAATSNYDDLIEFLSNRKRLSKSINDIVAAFPNAKEAVVKKLKNLAIHNPEFELNLDDDSGVPKDEEPEATPVPAPESTPEPAPKPDNDDYLFDSSLPAQAPKPDPEPVPEPAEASTPEPDPEITPKPTETPEPDTGHDLDMNYGLDEQPAQDTSTDEASALEPDTHRDQDTDSGSVEMPPSSIEASKPNEEASPEVVALNTKKFTKLLMKMFEMDPETYPNRLRKVITEFLELRHEPAKWGKCFVDDQDSDLVYRLEDYERLCMVKAFWSGDNRKSNERRELEWPKMDQKMKAFVNSLRHNIALSFSLADSKEKLKAALKILINKIRQIDKNF